jgi:hypothetical protein
MRLWDSIFVFLSSWNWLAVQSCRWKLAKNASSVNSVVLWISHGKTKKCFTEHIITTFIYSAKTCFRGKTPHNAKEQFNPNPVKKKSLLILDAPEHEDSGNINFKIGRRSSVYQLFSKRDFYFIKCGWNWQKWPKMEFFNFFWKSLIF